jgi:hypothetical protein
LAAAGRAARHELVTRLQLLTLTAELLALELRDGSRTTEQVQRRGHDLRRQVQSVARAAQWLPARRLNGGDDGGSFADSAPLREIRAYAGFIVHHAERPDVERDVLAEYVDALHEQSAALIQSIDEPAGE